ncbi:hypothetical protein [Nonomuraea dietziae]
MAIPRSGGGHGDGGHAAEHLRRQVDDVEPHLLGKRTRQAFAG